MSTLIIFFLFMTNCLTAQESVHTAGGNTTAADGSVSYSIGQISYKYSESDDFKTNEGVQQVYEIQTVGIDPSSKMIDLSIYPNPTSDLVKISFSDEEVFKAAHYRLSNLNGQMLAQKEIVQNHQSIDFSSYSAGVYLVEIYNKKHNIQSFKIIKK